jgi:hypothetical protein
MNNPNICIAIVLKREAIRLFQLTIIHKSLIQMQSCIRLRLHLKYLCIKGSIDNNKIDHHCFVVFISGESPKILSFL